MGKGLSKTRTVLDLEDNPEGVIFSLSGTTTILRHQVELDFDAWREMGEPDQITVTIEPGDLLNGKDK